MKRAPYMNRAELEDFLKVGVSAGELEAIAKRTPDKVWQRKMKTAATYLSNIITERLFCLDKKQLESVARRKDHAELRVYSSDEVRVKDATETYTEGNVTVNNEDLIILFMCVEHACCNKCKQGKGQVAKCEIRTVLHRLGCPVYIDTPEEGECEFCYYNKANDLEIQLKEE